MEFSELTSSAIEALILNKLRTALAALGIIIGIGSVITLLSLGQASQQAVQSQIQSLGSNLLTVIPGSIRPGNIQSASGTSTTLTLEDAKAIVNNHAISGIQNISAELLRRTQVVAGRNNTNTQVVGVLPSYQTVHNLAMQQGTFIAENHVGGVSRVAVLGPTVTSDLFGEGVNPVGQIIKINKQSFRIIGETMPKGGSGFQNQDDIIFIPITTAQKQLFGVNFIGSMSIEVKNSELMNMVRDQVGYFLIARHKISNPMNADFTILSQSDLLGAVTQVTGTFTALLSGIAAISLLVGGIGIMNIMLVTVTERTHEIGLRKALGATKSAIVKQFLIEAIILTCVGGLIGMFVGILISYMISFFVKLPFVLSWQSILLACVVSGGIGILFGWYPAKKASSLSPIEALRYE